MLILGVQKVRPAYWRLSLVSTVLAKRYLTLASSLTEVKTSSISWGSNEAAIPIGIGYMVA